MKGVRITYTTKTEFSPQNQKNIQNVMSDLQKLNHLGINYNSCLNSDGKTFVHTAFFTSDEDQKILTELPSFKNFQMELQASELEIPPKQETITLVGSSRNIFS